MTASGSEPGRPSDERTKGDSLAASLRGIVTDNVPDLRIDHRALVIVNAVLVILLLGVVIFSTDATSVKWATGGTLIVFGVNSILVFLLSRSSQRADQAAQRVTQEAATRTPGDYERRRKAAESVNGDWWQIILYRDDQGKIVAEGLTIVNIRLYVDGGSYGLDGELFTEAGKSRAKWRADAVAIKNLAPLELFYRFQGFSFRVPVASDPSTGDVTGIGVFSFVDAGSGKASISGDGWFATGHVERLEFGRRRDVHLCRVTEGESEILDGDRNSDDSTAREHLIANRYLVFAERYGADF